MTAETMTGTATGETVHPGWVRICHWINAVAILVMIGSGWQIFDAAPLFDFTFSRSYALGNWLGGALLWHLAAMWVLVINGFVYVTLGFVTGRFRRKLWPIYPSEIIADIKAALAFKLSHDDLSHYNAVQKVLYVGIILVAIIIIASGLGIWKPVQFQEITAFYGGYDVARWVHFFAMAAIVLFLFVHVLLALIVPKSLRAMIIGR